MDGEDETRRKDIHRVHESQRRLFCLRGASCKVGETESSERESGWSVQSSEEGEPTFIRRD